MNHLQISAIARFAAGTIAALFAALIGLSPSSPHAQLSAHVSAAGPDKSRAGRTVLTRDQLLNKNVPSAPVDDLAAFATPANAAAPAEIFEGTLTLSDLQNSGSFTPLSDVFEIIPSGDSPWKHLPPFKYHFVGSAGALIPVVQGLTITGSPAWNCILGPGREWQEPGDGGYLRAAFPFALIQRNQNCVHNGEMTFLYAKSKTPKISNVYFQITQETCYPMKFNMWGMAPAAYEPAAVPRANELRSAYAAEIANRLPVKPIAALQTDHPNANINLAAIPAQYKHPSEITTYGIVVNGVNYTSGCPTRSGEYAFCSDMRVPSYSIAKSVFAGVALMRLGQLYGAGIYNERIANWIPKKFIRGHWDQTTFNNVSDMATGNFNTDTYEGDEDGPTMDKFLVDESFDAKLDDAFAFTQNFAPPGTKWIYQSSATFVVTQAMNAYLEQRRGSDADIFNLVRDDVYKPLHFSAGGLTTIRTGNSPTGAPSGYYGLFFIKDDVAKIGDFLNNAHGEIAGAQILEKSRLNEALFRSPNAASTGVPILGASTTSALGPPKSGSGASSAENTRRYAHGFWGRRIAHDEFPEYTCDFWISLMAGYGGNLVIMLPNGVTYYIFSDGFEFPWPDAVHQATKLAPPCQ